MNKLLFIACCVLVLFTQCKSGNTDAAATDSLNAPVTGSAIDTANAGGIVMDHELPARQSLRRLFDEMDYQQASQLYLWALPLVTFAEWQHIHEDVFGAKTGDIVFYNSYQDRLGILTANATTPYIMAFIDLAKSGPIVIEMPAGHTAGGLGDFWQRESAVIGEMGPDKGRGGKYLLVPPGQQLNAGGFYSVPCKTMNIFFGFRSLDPDSAKTMALLKGVKIYPYASRSNPPATRIVSPAGKKYFAGEPDGLAYWQRLHAILQEEPVEERDRFFASWLNNLGIVKGKPFAPDERQKKILETGAAMGKRLAMANSFAKRFDSVHHWPDRQWDYVMIISDPSQRAANYDEFFRRSSYFFEAVTYSKAMITKIPNVGQAYLGAYTDEKGQWLLGDNQYQLHVPANPPAVNFWSLTVYDATSRCLIDNPQRNADLSSRKDLVKNADGSVDLYFGPTAPAGKEKNWVQTLTGKHWFAYMRFYGPTEAYFNRSWKMGDITKTN